MTDPIDRFLAAVALMGSDSPDAIPDDLARRCGAIEVLGLIGGEAASRALAAYVRANAPARIAPEPPFVDRSGAPRIIGFAGRVALEQIAPLPRPRADVAAALAALGRLGGAPDLSGTCLQGARLAGAWAGARLEEARLEGADLSSADLTGAVLRRAQMPGATLTGTRLDRADLSFANLFQARGDGLSAAGAKALTANLCGADLKRAAMPGADLYFADLSFAVLDGADLSGASLRTTNLRGTFAAGARFAGALFERVRWDDATDLAGADLTGAGFRTCNLAGIGFDAGALDQAFGDRSNTLPDGMARPAGWSDRRLDWPDFEAAWRGMVG